jgi:hypothetical protein
MALVSPKRKSSPPIAEEPAHATVMESYSGIDAGKERRFRSSRKPLTPETGSSLQRNLRAGREALINVPSTCSPGWFSACLERRSSTRRSISSSSAQAAFTSSSAGAFVQDFHQTIDKPATKVLARLGRDWADKDKRLLEPLAKPAALFAPELRPPGTNRHRPPEAEPESPFSFQRLTPPNPGINR